MPLWRPKFGQKNIRHFSELDWFLKILWSMCVYYGPINQLWSKHFEKIFHFIFLRNNFLVVFQHIRAFCMKWMKSDFLLQWYFGNANDFSVWTRVQETHFNRNIFVNQFNLLLSWMFFWGGKIEMEYFSKIFWSMLIRFLTLLFITLKLFASHKL